MRARVIIVVLIILIILGLGGLYVYRYITGLDEAYNPEDTEIRIVEIPNGTTTDRVGEILVNQGIIGDLRKFKIFVRFNDYDGMFMAGTYRLSPAMDMKTIADTLCTGQAEEVSFTIPEGFTVEQIIEKLSTEGIVNEATFRDLLLNADLSQYDFIPDKGPQIQWLEGYLFPETYSIIKDSDEMTVLTVLLDQFDKVYTDEMKSRADELGLTTNQVITIASIIERECRVDSERSTISSVIYNRLELGMKLEMDATVQYAQGEVKEFLLYEDLEIDSPYNTYMYTGLPPGPIACPGLASINAALYPADTDYLYYVVSDAGDGSHAFSEDYETFLGNKDAYYDSVG